MRGLQAALTRKPYEGCEDERLGRLDTLAAYTAGGAWAAHRDEVTGRIAPGLAADAVVDLGLLQPPERVKPQLRSGLSTSHGAWLRQASNVQSKGVYVGTIY